MAKLLIVILIFVMLLGGGYFLVSSGKVGVLNKLTGSKDAPASSSATTQNNKVNEIQASPDITDASIEEDLTALDRDLAEVDNTNSDLSKEINGL